VTSRPGYPALRWGIAGYGDVVRRRALPALAALGQPVAGIWGRDRARAAALAAGHRAGFGTEDFDVLLAAADAVYIATPVSAHVPLCARALRAGRHVLVEKPLAGGLPYDLARLQELAAAAGTVAAVAYYRRHSPAARFLRGLLAAGHCQRVRLRFRSAFSPAPGDPMSWRTDISVAGGGVLADAGSHRIDLLCLLLGPPGQVAGELTGLFPGGAERRARVELRWPGGCQARALFEWSPRPARDELTITGPGLRVDCPALDSGRLLVTTAAGRASHHLPPAANPVTPAFADLIECAATGRAPGCTLADAAVTDTIIAAAMSSAAGVTPGRSRASPRWIQRYETGRPGHW
jgi:predicted dehydrogenase